MANLLIVTLIRSDNGNWSWTVGDKNRQMEPRQGAGAYCAEQALKEALHDAQYRTLDDRMAGEA